MKLLIAFLQSIILLSVPAMHSQSLTGQMRTTPIGVGDVAPDFALEDQNRHRVSLTDVRGKSPVVLVFYRGYW